MDQCIRSKQYSYVMTEDIIKVVGQGYTVMSMNTSTTDTQGIYLAASRCH